MNQIEKIVWFRRDLRLDDHDALLSALSSLSKQKTILPVFIFDPRQVSSSNQYRSAPSLSFLVESLRDLDQQLRGHNSRLFVFHGLPHTIFSQLVPQLPALRSLHCHLDCTPFSQTRDEAVQEVCQKHDIAWEGSWGELMFPPKTILTGSGTIYQKFTPFYNKAKKHSLPKPRSLPKNPSFASSRLSFSQESKPNWEEEYVPALPDDFTILHHGGRTAFLKRWNSVKELKDYNKTRNYPEESTTEWSAALKYGLVSIREALAQLERTVGLENGIARQLYFREFYYQVMVAHPRQLQTNRPGKNKAFLEKWEGYSYGKPNKKWLKAWKEGKTGFPIIDAGMRQMLHTGFMHNRVRMLCASFLNKDLGIDWRIGEQYFAEKLYDYDPTQNNAGWQSTCGMGASALDWYRVMNPWTQTKEYDPDAAYIKEWVPELHEVPIETIFNWDAAKESINQYPLPIVSHDERRQLYLAKTKQQLP